VQRGLLPPPLLLLTVSWHLLPALRACPQRFLLLLWPPDLATRCLLPAVHLMLMLSLAA
jgi:hypothetical protein